MPRESVSRSRRNLLRTITRSSAAAVGMLAFPAAISETLIPKAHGTEVVRTYPRKKIASLSEIQEQTPVEFSYPDDGHANMLIKIGQPASDGVGPDGDIVAFSSVCPHMGCPFDDTRYSPERPAALGPCVCHFTCFDISKGGMQVQGVSSQDLPQILLEDDGRDVYAVGVRGLLHGRASNQ